MPFLADYRGVVRDWFFSQDWRILREHLHVIWWIRHVLTVLDTLVSTIRRDTVVLEFMLFRSIGRFSNLVWCAGACVWAQGQCSSSIPENLERIR